MGRGVRCRAPDGFRADRLLVSGPATAAGWVFTSSRCWTRSSGRASGTAEHRRVTEAGCGRGHADAKGGRLASSATWGDVAARGAAGVSRVMAGFETLMPHKAILGPWSGVKTVGRTMGGVGSKPSRPAVQTWRRTSCSNQTGRLASVHCSASPRQTASNSQPQSPWQETTNRPIGSPRGSEPVPR